MDFVHVALPSRVVFSAGSRSRLGAELDTLGVTQVIILATAEHAQIASELARDLGPRAGFVYPGAKQSTRSDVTHSALVSAQSCNADGIVAVGGDAAMNLSKAVAVRSDLPQVVLPMSFGGSEASAVLRESGATGRVVRRHAKAMPETILYDPELTAQMKPGFAVASAFTAMAHAVEASIAPEQGPFINSFADRALADLSSALPQIANGADAATEGQALTAAWLAGNCLGSAGMGLHHQLAYALADMQDTPVEDVHAILLGYTAAYNMPAAADRLARVARQIGAEDAAQGFYALMRQHAPRTSLAELGLNANDLDQAVQMAGAFTGTLVRPVDPEALRAMLQRALEGSAPE